MSCIPADAKYWRKRDASEIREFRNVLAGWIAGDVAANRPIEPGMVWVYRAVLRLIRVTDLVAKRQHEADAAAAGVVPGAHVVISWHGLPTHEGVVESVDGCWANLDTGRALLIGAEVEVILSGCLHGCVLGEGHDEPCLTDEDIAEERLKARDYDAWAAL